MRIFFYCIALTTLIANVLFLTSCSHSKIYTAKASGASFDSLFVLKDSIEIKPENKIKSIIAVCVDKKNNLIICDYLGENIANYNQTAKTFSFLNDTIDGKKLLKSPLSCATDENGNLFVSSNKNRRILLYDTAGILRNSFIISGGNITPVGLLIKGQKIFMGGFNLEKGTLIHQYNYNGEYLKDFCKQAARIVKTNFGTSINYPLLDDCGGTIWVVQTFDYTLNQYGANGNELQQIIFKPNYYVDIPSSLLVKEKHRSMLNEENNFSRQVVLCSTNNRFFVQVEMPRSKIIDPENYFKGSNFRLDEFNSKGANIVCGINCAEKRLLFVDKRSNEFYFLTKSNFKKGIFTIKKYKFIG